MMVVECHRNLEVLKACMGNARNDDPNIDDTVRQLMHKPLETMEDINSLNDLLLGNHKKCKNVVSNLKLIVAIDQFIMCDFVQ